MAEITAAAVKAFVDFIKARERHREAKEIGAWRTRVKPDPIIAKYRFCNVRRNDDRVTRWIHEWAFVERGWREDPNLWFALIVARLFNNEDTLRDIGDYVLPFKPAQMARALAKRKAAGLKNFNAAYIVSTNGRSMDKVEYVIRHVLEPAWKERAHYAHKINKQETLAVVHEILCGLNGIASFMAAQVAADLKYAAPGRWADFHTFAASGPGSRRGLNVVCGRDPDAPWNEAEFRSTLLRLRDMTNSRLSGWAPITAQDIQNCLCEYFKYSKVRMGIGEPKQLYKPLEA